MKMRYDGAGIYRENGNTDESYKDVVMDSLEKTKLCPSKSLGYDILRLSGSYMLSENGGPQKRTGGLTIAVCSGDGRLIASSLVQVLFSHIIKVIF